MYLVVTCRRLRNKRWTSRIIGSQALGIYLLLCFINISRAQEIANVAQDKPANQSSVFNGDGKSHTADLAVDGNTNKVGISRCASTGGATGVQQWWMVDLLEDYTIGRIEVYTRNDNSFSQGGNLNIQIWRSADNDPTIGAYNCAVQDPMTFHFNVTNCNQDIMTHTGRYVRFAKYGSLQDSTLTLCQVLIYGTPVTVTSTSTSTQATNPTKLSSSPSPTSVSTTTALTSSSLSTAAKTSSSQSTAISSPLSSTNMTSAFNATGDLSGGAIAGIVIGSFVGACVVAVIILAVICRDRFPCTLLNRIPKKKHVWVKRLQSDVVVVKPRMNETDAGASDFAPITYNETLKKNGSAKGASADTRFDDSSGSQADLTDTVSDVRETNGNHLHVNKTFSVECVQGVDVAVEEFPNYVHEKLVDSDMLITEEFKSIPFGAYSPCVVGEMKCNLKKNRFLNILPYDCSRVLLAQIDGDPHSDYINANYITGFGDKEREYIATQAPMTETVPNFWRLVWEMNVQRIAMVTNLVEDTKRKCEHYWPAENGDSMSWNGIGVINVHEQEYAMFVVRTFSLSKEGEDSRTVRQFHFIGWSDKTAPEYVYPILAFLGKIRSFDDLSSGPLLVHCSAGVGRSGTLIALDSLINQSKHEGTVNVAKCVYRLRRDRMNMVQTMNQYRFLYMALAEAIRTRDVAVPVTSFPRIFSELTKKTESRKRNKLTNQYEILRYYKSSDKGGKKDGASKENQGKNRYPHLIPYDKYRPFLSSSTYKGVTNYINATFLDGYKRRNSFIITQAPLPNTIVDFWMMIAEHKCKTIIMLNTLDGDDVKQYWPDGTGDSEEYGSNRVTVEASRDDQIPNVVTRDILIEPSNKNYTQKIEPLSLRHFQQNGWTNDAPTAPDKASLVGLLHVISVRHQELGGSPIVVHCLNGLKQSGLFCVALNVLDKIKDDQQVDIFNAVRSAQMHSPQVVDTKDQYRYLHELVQESINQNRTEYANVKI